MPDAFLPCMHSYHENAHKQQPLLAPPSPRTLAVLPITCCQHTTLAPADRQHACRATNTCAGEANQHSTTTFCCRDACSNTTKPPTKRAYRQQQQRLLRPQLGGLHCTAAHPLGRDVAALHPAAPRGAPPTTPHAQHNVRANKEYQGNPCSLRSQATTTQPAYPTCASASHRCSMQQPHTL